MCCMNSTIVVSHEGLFLYVNLGYLGSYHNVSILQHSFLYKNWRTNFEHGDENFQYLLRDLGYMSVKISILHSIEVNACSSDVPRNAIDAFNKMHANSMICVKWGIESLKRKSAR